MTSKPKRLRRVLVLCHQDLVPPKDKSEVDEEQWEATQTERDVIAGLKRGGHQVQVVGLLDELAPLKRVIDEFKPHVVFNLLEEFQGQAVYDFNVVAYLQLLRVPYTGCNPRGLILARDKAMSKQILGYHRVRVPRFAVMRKNRKVKVPARLEYPLIVKSLTEDASLGISEASVVRSDDKLAERVAFIHRTLDTHAIVEEYIDGRELYVTVIGNRTRKVLPPWEIRLDKLRADAPRIATRRVKWDKQYQKEKKISFEEADLPAQLLRDVERTSKRIFRSLKLSGYARIDFRLRDDGRLYFLEANPNPDIAKDSEVSYAAESEGWDYDELLARIVKLGMRSLS